MAPRILPAIFRFVRLVYRLSFDRRVNIVLRLLIPLAIIYFLSPIDLAHDRKLPYLGRVDDVIIFGFAVLLLTRLAPKHVIDEHMGRAPRSNRPEDKDPDKVVDGSSKVVDE